MSGPAPLEVRLTFIASIVVAIVYFFVARMPSLMYWKALLHLALFGIGGLGFISLMIWNVLMQKKSLIAVNMFFTMLLIFFLVLMLIVRT